MLRFHFMRFIFKIVALFLLARIRMIGRENIPAHGPYIVSLNHMSTADTPLLLISFPAVQWRYFAGEKWRSHPIWGPLMTWLGAVYIRRGEVDRQGLKDALQALKDGYVFGLAPEGTRSKTGHMMQAKDGAAYLASRAGVPILPVGVVNTDHLFANIKKLRMTDVEVRVGKPFVLPEIGRRAKSNDLTAYTELIMVQIANLLPERYHGFYKNSPALAALQRGDDPWPFCQHTSGEQVSSEQLPMSY